MQQRLVNGNQAFHFLFKYFSEHFEPTHLLFQLVSIENKAILRER